jgi:hypothetical protein
MAKERKNSFGLPDDDFTSWMFNENEANEELARIKKAEKELKEQEK